VAEAARLGKRQQAEQERIMCRLSPAFPTRRALLALAVSAIAGRQALGQSRRPARIGEPDVSFHAAASGVVQEELAKAGVQFEVVRGTHAELYAKLGRGEIDLLASTWLPNGHGALFSPLEGRLVKLARLYGEARHGLAVPDFAPAGLTSISDLIRPEFAPQAEKTIVALGSSAAISAKTQRAIDAYGLKAAGFSMRHGKPLDWANAVETAFAKKRLTALPFWQPQFLAAIHKVRMLADPLGVYGPADEAFLIARADIADFLPGPALELLKGLDLPLAAVNELDRLIVKERLSPRAAAAKWLNGAR
jgi:glycine betaine/proline transport system substrate-binding protein